MSFLFGGLGTTYDVHLGLIGALFVLIELFLLDVTAEALWAKMDRKSAFWKRVGQYAPKFHTEGDVPTNHFCMDS